ncbi:MAG: TldD/PmbA family protein [Lachnospiraceae bacterium]|nr:TldD/PmbA family protein [Lachnospiraceae bacterium]
MQVHKSVFIIEKKPLLKKLLSVLLEKYEYVSILATDSDSKNYRVSSTGTSIGESGFLCERGFVMKVYDKGRFVEYSFNEISEDSIAKIAGAVDALVASKKEDESFDHPKFSIPEDSPLSFEKSTDYEISPVQMGDEAIIRLLTKLREKGLAYSERIIDCSALCSYQVYTKLFLSPGRDMTQSVMWVCGSIMALARDEDRVEEGYRPVSCLGGMEILDKLESNVEKACDDAIAKLDAEPIVPGEYECICEPDVTGMIVHEAFGHGVEMDMFVKDRALAKQYIGKQVASELITMHDGACVIPQVATYFFDDEGVPAQDTVVIKDGILQTGISDSLSAAVLGTAPTGNGRRENSERKAYTRMTNTIFEAGTSKVEDMIASVKYGMLLSNAESGMEDPKNWGIQLMVGMAREIKDGKLTGKVFSPIVLTGYVPDLLKSISMISDTIEAGGSGFCGKGYKEWVKVSDGGPYIKARIRLG